MRAAVRRQAHRAAPRRNLAPERRSARWAQRRTDPIGHLRAGPRAEPTDSEPRAADCNLQRRQRSLADTALPEGRVATRRQGSQTARRGICPGHRPTKRRSSVWTSVSCSQPSSRRCPIRTHVRRPIGPPLLYFAAVLLFDLFELFLTSGAKGIRTPDLLHAIRRQHVHPRPSPQVTVLPRPSRSPASACCGTFLLYRCRPADTALLAQPLLPRGGMELIPARNGRVSRSRIWIGHRHHTQGSHASCS